MVIAGGKSAGLKGGSHQKVAKCTPMANLHVDLINRMGVELEQFGDSTGRLAAA